MFRKFLLAGTFVSLTIHFSFALWINEKFTVANNIGNPALKGSFRYAEGDQSWLLSGAGKNMWDTRDEFFFLSRPARGDMIFSACVGFPGKGIEPHRKAGLMFRSSLDEDAPYVDVAIHGDGFTSLQYRSVKGGDTKEVSARVSAPEFVQIEKSGDNFILRISKSRTAIDEVASVQVILGPEFQAGMFVCSHNPAVIEQAYFRNVRLDIPASTSGGEKTVPSSSRLEVLDVETGIRKIVYAAGDHIEAPNWSRDGRSLLFNGNGKLFRFNLRSGKIRPVDTGHALANNNDHGYSFNGRMLAISNHTEEKNTRHSIIYVLRAKGGNPRRITENGPSYWHGWSPDDQWLTYCAERNGNYDVYRIPLTGGEETRLTSAEGLDDGPEFSPCGKYIYFNSDRNGTMQIWRMKPDGSEQEQVTKDQFNNWFAHPSPDGSKLVFLTYLPDIPASSHPPDQRVMIRIVSPEGGPVKALAFLYGGQGTMNVPSWSPDSRKVAFMSYTY
jgi:Tol biopolymer transport system component